MGTRFESIRYDAHLLNECRGKDSESAGVGTWSTSWWWNTNCASRAIFPILLSCKRNPEYNDAIVCTTQQCRCCSYCIQLDVDCLHLKTWSQCGGSRGPTLYLNSQNTTLYLYGQRIQLQFLVRLSHMTLMPALTVTSLNFYFVARYDLWPTIVTQS